MGGADCPRPRLPGADPYGTPGLMRRLALLLAFSAAAGCGGSTISSDGVGDLPIPDAGADAPGDTPGEPDAPPWTSGGVRLEMVWAADIENQTAGWAGERFFGPTLTPDGDVLVGGSLEGKWAMFGGDPVATMGNDIVAARLGRTAGNALWKMQRMNDAFEFGVSALGSGDTLLVTGSFRNTLDVGGDAPLVSDPDPAIPDAYTRFFAAYDGAGDLRWATTLPFRKGTQFLPEVAWHATGGVALASLGAWAQVTLGDSVFEPVLGSILVGRLDAAGKPVWGAQSQPETLADLTNPHDVAVTATGRVFVTASHVGRASLGGVLLDSAGPKTAMLLAFEPLGELAWTKSFSSPGEPPELRVALAGDDVLVYGVGKGPLDFGEGPRGGDAMAGFVARFGPDGSLRWSREFGGEGVGAMTTATSGTDVYVAGGFSDTLDHGAGTLASAGGSDAFVAKLGAAGQTLWAARMGDEWYQGIDELAVDQDESIVLRTGSIASTGPGSGSIVISRWRVVQE